MDSELLRKVQMEQLEIAKEVKRVCEVLDIPYFLDAGTLLGAIRHKGFIPWDDDLDIGMLRKDYDRFLKEAPEILDKKYFLQTWYSDSMYGLAYAKLRKNNTIYREETAKESEAHCGFFVDILPYDVIPLDEKKQHWQKQRHFVYRRCILMKSGYQPWVMADTKYKQMIRRIAYLPIKLLSLCFSREKLIKKYEEVCTAFNKEESMYLYSQDGASDYGTWMIPRVCVDKLTLCKFEDDEFTVPEDYDRYLTEGYGEYMQLPPIEQRENRHKIIEVKFDNE